MKESLVPDGWDHVRSILGSLLRLFAVHFDTPYLLETCLLCVSFLLFD